LTQDAQAVAKVASAQLDATGKVVTLTLESALQAGANYTISISGIKDLANNQMDAVTATFNGSASTASPQMQAGTSNQLSVVDADESGEVSNNDYIVLSFNSPVKLTDGTAAKNAVSNITDITALKAILALAGSGANEDNILEGATLAPYPNDNTKLKLTLAKTVDAKGWNAVTLGTTTINIAATNYIVSAIDDSQATAAGSAQTIIAPSNFSVGPEITNVVFTDENNNNKVDAGDTLLVTFDKKLSVTPTNIGEADFQLVNKNKSDTGLTLAVDESKTQKVGDNQIKLVLEGTTNDLNATDSAPVLTGAYLINKSDGSSNIKDVWNNNSKDPSGLPATLDDAHKIKLANADTVAPYITDAKYVDNGSLGLGAGDQLVLTFSENVWADLAELSNGDGTTDIQDILTVGNDHKIANATTPVTVTQTAPNKLVITYIGSTTAIPGDTVELAGTGSGMIRDLAGNIVRPRTMISGIDAAAVKIADDTGNSNDTTAPTFTVSAQSVDNGGDKIVLNFSEPIDNSTLTQAIVRAASEITVKYDSDNNAENGGATPITLTNATTDWNANNTALTITLNEGTDGAFIPDGKYVSVALTSNTKDLAGNGVASSNPVYTTAAVSKETSAPTIAASSVLQNGTGGTEGTIENGDKIVLNFSEAMDTTAIGTSFDVAVTGDTITVLKEGQTGAANTLATITTTGKQYNTHATDTMTFNASTASWSADRKTLTITLANKADDTAATDVTAGATSIVAGGLAKDLAGNTISNTPVTGDAASRF
jgi:hypothetical protein